MSRAYDNNQTLQQKIIRGANILAECSIHSWAARPKRIVEREGQRAFYYKRRCDGRIFCRAR